MTIQEGFDAVNEYFGPIRKEAYAKIGNPYKKKKVKEEVVEETANEEYDSDDEYIPDEYSIKFE